MLGPGIVDFKDSRTFNCFYSRPQALRASAMEDSTL